MTTTTATTDRIINRAPKGGAVCPISGRFYRGGQFMPLAPADVVVKPAALEGSSRQVAWAERLRKAELARLAEEIATRRLFLSDKQAVDAAGVRRAIRRDEVARFNLLNIRSAAAIIDRRVMA